MNLQKVYDTISKYNQERVLRLKNIFQSYHFSEDDFYDVYNFIHINKLNIKWYKIIHQFSPINERVLETAVFFDFEYFKAICNYSDIELSFKDNTLITHFLITEELEGAIFLYGFKEIKESFDSNYFSDLVGEDVVNKFLYMKNIKNF